MKLIVSIFIFLITLNNSFSQTGDIKVKVIGITNSNGNIEIGLYNKEEGFTIVNKTYKRATFKASKYVKTDLVYTFKNIPLGNYAIAVFHDENKNSEIDKNFFGVPTEYYGFSLNKYGTFGPPDFDVVDFKIVENKIVSLIIRLK